MSHKEKIKKGLKEMKKLQQWRKYPVPLSATHVPKDMRVVTDLVAEGIEMRRRNTLKNKFFK